MLSEVVHCSLLTLNVGVCLHHCCRWWTVQMKMWRSRKDKVEQRVLRQCHGHRHQLIRQLIRSGTEPVCGTSTSTMQAPCRAPSTSASHKRKKSCWQVSRCTVACCTADVKIAGTQHSMPQKDDAAVFAKEVATQLHAIKVHKLDKVSECEWVVS